MQVVLLPPLATTLAMRRDGRRLMRRLARARPLPALPPGRSAQIEAFFGIPPAELAGIAAAADGLEAGLAWVSAEPVVVHVDIASLRLIAFGEGIGLSEQEEAVLFARFAEWCGAAGVEARRAGRLRWYLARPVGWPLPGTDPPDRWLGRSLDRSWRPPAGAWGRLVAEIEMLLARDPLNEARVRRGELPVTGVWVWGGGRGAAPEDAAARRAGPVMSADRLVLACARRAGMEPLPAVGDRAPREISLLDLAASGVAQEGSRLPVPAEWWFACGRRFALGRLDVLRFWRRPPEDAAAAAPETGGISIPEPGRPTWSPPGR
jgi:hypothetical protein